MSGFLRRLQWRFLVVVLAAGLLVVPASAQAPASSRAERELARVLERGEYLLLDRDTVLGPAFRTPGDLVVWDARVRLEGEVVGSVLAVQGTVVLRPGSRVGGRAVAAQGLVLASAQAEVAEVLELAPGRTVRAEREGERLRVEVVRSEAERPRVGLGGLLGFRRVAYDRVDGLSVSWGPQWRITGPDQGARLDAWATLRTARRVGGGAELVVPVGGEAELRLGAESATRTNEGWIRGTAVNSAGALLLGRDLRDYHESRAVWLRVGRSAAPLEERLLRFSPYAMVSGSRDRSLPPRSRTAVAGRARLERPNRAVLEDVVYAGEVGAALGWRSATAAFTGAALVEHLRLDELGTDHTRWAVEGRWAMEALWRHRVGVRWHARGSLAGEPAPPQRWSFVGGQGTLPTLPLAAHSGDRVAFVESRYGVPLPFLDLPALREPVIELLHATGTAWVGSDTMPGWDQNLGIGVSSSWVRLRAWIDPAVHRPRPTWLVEIAAP